MSDLLRKGIAAYQSSMSPREASPEDASASEPADGGVARAQAGIARAKARILEGKNGLLKTARPPEGAESKTRRVAKFLILVGAEQAAKILALLDARQIEDVTKEIALVKGIDGAEAEAIVAEFTALFSGALGPRDSGGVETARRMLHAAYGPERGEEILNKTVPGSKENPLAFLGALDAEQIHLLLKDEKPGAAALVLARLPPKISADAIGKFPAELKKEILLRLARKREVSPDILQSVAQSLKAKARLLEGSGEDGVEIDGMQKLAAILKHGDYSFGDRLLGELESEDPEIGKNLKDKLYTLEDVIAVHDRALADKLKRMTDKDVAILLRGRSVALRKKFFSNVSSGRAAMIAEEDDLMGPVSRRERDDVANRFIAWFRQARADGEIATEGDEDWVT
ncbi:MAG: flagellar motor switch protein FliG [Treponema sp.]|nr:flagellar motor switch protein FliG [Treponema sp.]